MTITRALVEAKLSDKKAEDLSNQVQAVTTVVGDKVPNGYNSREDFAQKQRSIFQAFNAQVANRQAIKAAIIQSNATTTVSVNGTKMTVAEAIERKQSYQRKSELLHNLRKQFADASKKQEVHNEKVAERLDAMLAANLGKDSKVKDSEYEAIARPFLDKNEVKILDPLGILNVIEKLDAEVTGFYSEVDLVLSESNARTEIEVELN